MRYLHHVREIGAHLRHQLNLRFRHGIERLAFHFPGLQPRPRATTDLCQRSAPLNLFPIIYATFFCSKFLRTDLKMAF